ncbi:uncharacterized protein [Amphiura filiformis]|uniref:uncharacterized protein n=1 Tax=Amphiura filiformis TaxID=82378 RepID=UPI003B223658
MAAIIFVLSMMTICSSVPINNKDACPTGCRCSVLQEPSSATTPAIFDQIDCNHGYLMSLSPNLTLSESLPPVRHFHINCATNDTINGALSLSDISLAHPSIVETLSVTSCDITTKQEWAPFNLSPLIMLNSFEITHSNLTNTTKYYTFPFCQQLRIVDLSFNLLAEIDDSVFHNLPNLHTIDLSNNRITHISQYSFYLLGSLQHLNLANNMLTNFQKFPNLITHDTIVDVDMLGNPLDCDCNMDHAIHSIGYDKSFYSNWPHHADFANQHFFNHTLLFCNKTHAFSSFPKPGISVAELLKSQIQNNTNYFLCDYPCPSPCSCFGYEQLTTTCINPNLTNIPSNVYNGTKVLNVLGNNIQHIPSLIFADLNCLLTLDLHGNNITKIEDDAFLGLGSLIVLQLSTNNLHGIKSSYFVHLKNLIRLELRYNHIAYIEQESFMRLNYLVHLDLSHNNLAFLPDPFLQTKYVMYLALNNNYLETLPNVLTDISNVSYVIEIPYTETHTSQHYFLKTTC